MDGYELYILDTSFQSVNIIDTYESFIWTDRYREAGDFELYLSIPSSYMMDLIPGYYLWVQYSDRLMIIEQSEIETNVESGNHLKITGRSLESILDRRIIWHQITVDGNVQSVIRTLINDQIISPALPERRISNFIFVNTSDDYINSCEIEQVQYLGENLYDVVLDICSVFDIGFKITYNENTGNFEFRLYHGTDRSYDQDVNPWVIFSPEYDNLIGTDYIENYIPYKNANLVAGEEPDKDSGKNRFFVYVTDSSDATGLNRREMFTDGSSKQQKYKDENDQDVELTDAQYIAVLKQFGLEELNKPENRKSTSFDGEMAVYGEFVYGKDFLLGDIVQMRNEYGIETSVKIVEMIMSQSTDGIKYYPTFESTSA